jgi:hypothetical protein
VWSLSGGPSNSESSLVSQHSNPSLVDTLVVTMQSSAKTTLVLGSDVSLDHVVSHHAQPVVMSMQSSAETTPIFGSDASLDHVVSHLVQLEVMLMQSSVDTTTFWGSDASIDQVFSHHIQPMIEEVVMLMKYSVNPTLLLESDKSKEVTFLMQYSANPTLVLGGVASFNHVLSVSSSIPFEQGSIPLSLSTLPPSPRMVSFDWNDLVEPLLPSYAPFHIMGIRRCIVDEISSTSIISSLA